MTPAEEQRIREDARAGARAMVDAGQGPTAEALETAAALLRPAATQTTRRTA